MASRIEGPDPPQRSGDPWTSADVKRWLIMPMKILCQQGILAGAGNGLSSTSNDTPSATFDIMAFARTVLGGRDNPEHVAVMTWARIMAAGGHAESSIAEWCREKGGKWTERTFYRRLDRGIARIVEAKNRVDCRYVPPKTKILLTVSAVAADA